MVRLISKQSRTSAGLKLTKLFDIDDFSVAKDSGNVLIIIIYCYLIIIVIVIIIIIISSSISSHFKLKLRSNGIKKVLKVYANYVQIFKPRSPFYTFFISTWELQSLSAFGLAR